MDFVVGRNVTEKVNGTGKQAETTAKRATKETHVLKGLML
jgi:hypothetical protein